MDQGADVTSHIDYLLRNSDSVAVLGVLINVGKRLPELFRSALKPLLAVLQFYLWDEARVKNSAHGFDGLTWARNGDLVFQMARDWHVAPYRQKNLIEIVSELCRQDRDLGDFVNASAAQWTPPDTEKEWIEFQIRVAQLDYRNYRVSRVEETGQEQVKFEYPADIRAAIAGFQQGKRRAREILAFPDNCRRFLVAPRGFAGTADCGRGGINGGCGWL